MENIEIKEYVRQIEGIKEAMEELLKTLKIDDLEEELERLNGELQSEALWKDQEKFTEVNQRVSSLRKKIEPWKQLQQETGEALELIELAAEEDDHDILMEVANNIDSFKKRFEELETRELLSGEDDTNDAYITIHPGAGGTESQDWASMLLRMYTRWAEKSGFKIEMIDYSAGDEAGIKGATVLIKGDFAFGFLKGESGIHRLVRISPFDSNKRRHTSFASVEIMPDVNDDIEIEINENDLKIDTYRASGAGGQHVNKTDSAVRITHIPTGVVVQCQNERSQHKNKSSAMKVLKARLYEIQRQEQEEKKQDLAGDKKDIAWGNQIRSYVFQPYTMVKDHRTGEETGSVDYVFDGEINRFIYAYLKSSHSH